MKDSFLYAITIVLGLTSFGANALEIDEKLTLRFLKVSSTKKTVLINRGGEDGLVVGDHAKFFITAGVVARGVAEKVSPSRSVWSLYRIVDTAEITQDKVLNLKIATPVKITEDPTKSMKEEVIPGGAETMVADAPAVSADDGKEVIVSDTDSEELKELGMEEKPAAKKSVTSSSKKSTKSTSVLEDVPVEYGAKKNWEAWGTLYFNSLSGTSDDGASESTSTVASAIDFSAGIEKYFLNSTGFMKELSLVGFLHKRSIEGGSDVKVSTDWFEYGIGANYHFYNSATQYNRLIGFGTLSLGKGSATIKNKISSGSVSEEVPEKGSNTFFSVGLGSKYILSSGFGIRAVLDYYSSSESFSAQNTLGETVTTKRTLSGPRVQFGLSYRF